MEKQGRKSAASLSIVTPIGVQERLAPPPELSTKEADLWRAVVATKPNDWFDHDNAPLLVEYCRAKTVTDSMQDKINAFQAECADTVDDLRKMKLLVDMQQKSAQLMATLAVKMRLTQQSRYTPKASTTANKKVAGSRPWES